MAELPKRRFALEEKDLAVEADENNKVAEEKEKNVYQILLDGEYLFYHTKGKVKQRVV